MYQNECLVCTKKTLKKYQYFFSKYLPNIIGRTAICKTCGHIQVWPMYSDEKINQINEQYHSGKFLSTTDSSANNQSKFKKLSEDLKDQELNGKNVLDIGAGEAWSKSFFDMHNMHYFAIEPIHKLQENIQKIGGTVIGSSIFESLDKFHEKFDLVVLRHVIEHTNVPHVMLSNIYKILKENSLLYIALPNAATETFKKPIRTSFYRPSHISYFHPAGITYLLERCGFKVELLNLQGEIAIIAKKNSPPYDQPMSVPNKFMEQARRMYSAAKSSLFSDCKNLAKLIYWKVVKK